MRIFAIFLALGVLATSQAVAASESAKMTGQDQSATEPGRHREQSAKRHKTHSRQNPTSSGVGTHMGSPTEK